LGALLCASGCSKPDEVIVETAAGHRAPDALIDQDAWALLPSGAISWMSLAAPALFRANFGSQVVALLNRTLPIPQNAGFDPVRDIDSLALGVYSMAGIDLAGIARGRFNAVLLDQAVSNGVRTQTGQQVTRVVYASRPLYVANGVGMTILTPSTMAFGDETGMRRILDRIEEGRVARAIPAWFEELLANQNAPFVWGSDLMADPLSNAARHQAQFLDNLRAARLLGNFEEPGLNFAGTLTYDDEAAAQRGAQTLLATGEALRSYAWLMALIGVVQPLRRLDAEPKGKETQVVAEVDGQAVGSLLGNADRLMALLTGH
jgi:hypothetical protein